MNDAATDLSVMLAIDAARDLLARSVELPVGTDDLLSLLAEYRRALSDLATAPPPALPLASSAELTLLNPYITAGWHIAHTLMWVAERTTGKTSRIIAEPTAERLATKLASIGAEPSGS